MKVIPSRSDASCRAVWPKTGTADAPAAFCRGRIGLPMTQGSPLIRLYPGRLPPDTGQRRKRILRAGRRAFAGYPLAMVEGAWLPSNTGRNFAKWASIAVDDSDDLNTVPYVQTLPGYPIDARRRRHIGGGGGILRPRGSSPGTAHAAPIESGPRPRGVGRFRW